jgi:GST-like protein
MMARPAVAAGNAIGVPRKETVAGGLQGFTDEHRNILWGDRQHVAR